MVLVGLWKCVRRFEKQPMLDGHLNTPMPRDRINQLLLDLNLTQTIPPAHSRKIRK